LRKTSYATEQLIHYYFIVLLLINSDIDTYNNTVIESPWKIYGEFIKEMLSSHNKLSDYNRYMKDNLSALQRGGIVSENESRMINRIIYVITNQRF
jgi:hypothetical protein